MREVVVVSGMRAAIGTIAGRFKRLAPAVPGAQFVRETLLRKAAGTILTVKGVCEWVSTGTHYACATICIGRGQGPGQFSSGSFGVAVDTLRASGIHRRPWSLSMSGSAMLFANMLAFAQSAPGAQLHATVPAPVTGPTMQVAPDQGLASFREGTYRGLVGKRLVQVQLVLDRSAEDSVTGSYFFFGEGANILLVGEFDGNQLHLEESRNGIDVSGTWDATLDADHIFGTWSDAGETVRVDFDLKRMGPATKT